MKNKLHLFTFLMIFMITGNLVSCDSNIEEQVTQPNLTHDFLRYLDNERTKVKVWYCSSVDVTYFNVDGTFDKKEELVNYDIWDMRFSKPAPNSDENIYSIQKAADTMGKLIPRLGRYELNASKNQITFGDFRSPLFSNDIEYDDLTFDVKFQKESYLGNVMDFIHVGYLPDGRKREVSFFLSTRMW